MGSSELNNEQELSRRIARGDEAAFRVLFDHYREKLARFAIYATTSEIVAEEIIQEVFIKVWINREALPGLENTGNYLFILTRNKVLDHLRKVAASNRLVEQIWAQRITSIDDTDHRLQAQESQRLIADALLQLPEQKQLIFRLSRVEGMSHEQIAVELGLSRSRVKNVIVEVLKYLRDYLARHSLFLLAVSAWMLG